MEANELRIGNYVNINRAHGRGENQIKVKEINLHYLNQVQRNEKYIEPVLLTEEWLVKFGFVKLDYHRFKIKPSHYFDYYYTYSVKDNCFRMYVEDGIMCLSTIEYVHQLQNLYFALTGFELIIQ